MSSNGSSAGAHSNELGLLRAQLTNVPLPVAASLEAEVDVSAARVVAAARAVLNYR